MTAFVARFAFGMTVKVTLACPSGEVLFCGRNPACGSSGGRPVEASSELNVHETSPVKGFMLAVILTSRFLSGRRSTTEVKDCCPAGGVKRRVPKEIAPKLKVERSTFEGSS